MFIVVPLIVNYFSAFSTLAKEFLDDIIVFLRPINTPLQRGNVDEVPNKIPLAFGTNKRPGLDGPTVSCPNGRNRCASAGLIAEVGTLRKAK